MSDGLSLKDAKKFLRFDESLGAEIKPRTYKFQLTVDESVHQKIMGIAGSKWRRGRIVNQILYSVLIMGGSGGVVLLSRDDMKKEGKIQKMQQETKASYMEIYKDEEFKERLREQREKWDAGEYDKKRFPLGPPPPPPASES